MIHFINFINYQSNKIILCLVCIYCQIIGEADEFQGDGSSRGDECSREMGVPGGRVFQGPGDVCSGGWVSKPRGMGVPVTLSV